MRRLLLLPLLSVGLGFGLPAAAATDCQTKFNEMVVALAADKDATPEQQIIRFRRLEVFYEVCKEGDEAMTDKALEVAEEAFGRPGN